MADKKPGGATDFLQAFSSESKYFLSHPFLWKVRIMDDISFAINSALIDRGEAWEANVSPSDLSKDGAILVARQVTLPQESSVFSPQSVPNRGGFLPGYALIERNDFLTRSFSINFIETQKDLEHGFMRPWAIALGIDGMTNFDLRTNIIVEQYNNKGDFKKGFKFVQAFPTAVEGYTLSHSSDDFIEKSVTFGCTNYEPLENAGGDVPFVGPPAPTGESGSAAAAAAAAAGESGGGGDEGRVVPGSQVKALVKKDSSGNYNVTDVLQGTKAQAAARAAAMTARNRERGY